VLRREKYEEKEKREGRLVTDPFLTIQLSTEDNDQLRKIKSKVKVKSRARCDAPCKQKRTEEEKDLKERRQRK